MQTTILRIIFKAAKVKLPDLIKSSVSLLKVENVLNPPQKPVRINKRKVGLEKIFSLKNPIATAITTQLRKLASSVPRGKDVAT